MEARIEPKDVYVQVELLTHCVYVLGALIIAKAVLTLAVLGLVVKALRKNAVYLDIAEKHGRLSDDNMVQSNRNVAAVIPIVRSVAEEVKATVADVPRKVVDEIKNDAAGASGIIKTTLDGSQPP